MIANRLNRLLQALALLIAGAAAMVATPAYADNICTFGGTVFTSPVDFGTVNIGRDAAVGSVIGSAVTRTLTYNCQAAPAPGYSIVFGAIGSPTATTSGDIAIGNGAGLRISTPTNLSGSVAFGPGPYGLADVAASTTGTFTLTFQLIKGGSTLTAGPFTIPGKISFWSQKRAAPVVESPHTAAFASTSGNIGIPTCSTSSVTVTLPTVSPADLTPVGTVFGATPFSINLVCPSGNPVRLFMTLTDSTDPTNRTKNLTLTPTSTATGVKIRVSRGTTDISYGADSPARAGVNQFQVGTMTAAGGPFSAAFTAAYVSTATVTGGTVNAIATYTMSYQ